MRSADTDNQAAEKGRISHQFLHITWLQALGPAQHISFLCFPLKGPKRVFKTCQGWYAAIYPARVSYLYFRSCDNTARNLGSPHLLLHHNKHW